VAPARFAAPGSCGQIEQAQQIFTAAAKNVGNNDYRILGHGIKTKTSTLTGPVAGVEVFSGNGRWGSFNRLPDSRRSVGTRQGEASHWARAVRSATRRL